MYINVVDDNKRTENKIIPPGKSKLLHPHYNTFFMLMRINKKLR